ncbi:MAG: DNA-binding transcriptional LysR family regulator [Halocynthiibacter sp.]|jgi:LysR family nod box-dependent transcriptional activator
MRFKRLDLNLLVALDHMLTLRSVSEAATRMHMSQSAMSNALTRLRTYFDDPLLVQVGRKMILTPRAEGMRGPVRDILVRVDATIDTDPVFRPEATDRQFSILLSDYTMQVLIPHVLAVADEAGSRVHFRFLPQTDQPYVMLERGEADLLIAPQQFCSSAHPSDALFEDRYVCVAWKDGAHGNGPLTAEAFVEAGHVVMVPPTAARSVETILLARLGITRREEVTSFSFSSLPELVVGTDRIATVHESIARKALARMPLVQRDLPFVVDGLSQHMQWHEIRAHDPGIQWLREIFHLGVERMNGH